MNSYRPNLTVGMKVYYVFNYKVYDAIITEVEDWFFKTGQRPKGKIHDYAKYFWLSPINKTAPQLGHAAALDFDVFITRQAAKFEAGSRQLYK